MRIPHGKLASHGEAQVEWHETIGHEACWGCFHEGGFDETSKASQARRRREGIGEQMKTSPTYLRWGLLVSAAAMAAVLVGAGTWVYSGVRQAATTVTRGQSLGIAFAARRTLRLAGEINPPVMHEVLSELAPQGLRFVEVIGPDHSVVGEAGSPSTQTRWLPGGHLGPAVSIAFGPGGASARIVAHSFDSAAMGLNQHPSVEASQAYAERHPLYGKELRFEVDSAAAHALVWRASITLVVSLLAAAVLMGLAAFFWRISCHAEKASLQLEHDRQLKILGQMSAVLGHEIRNPLASLKGHVQLLLEKLPLEHAGRKGAEVVLRETVRLEELSRQVLEFARTGAVHCEPADPVAIVRNAVENIGGTEVHLDVRGGPATWPLDSARMEEVLVNLLRNARDASPAGQRVDVTVDIQPERDLRVEVRDHGQGIVDGEEERVFEPFYTRRAKGTGLGLALARRIVEGHGGAITAHNHPDGGAVFSVTLPPRTQGA
jgi:two-component system sensor histidine kinase HydH